MQRALARGGAELERARGGLRVFRHLRQGVAATLAQLAAWALQVLSAYFVLVALDLQRTAGLAGAAAVLVAVNVTAVVPVTPSNVGVFQAACVAVLASFGVSGGHALAYGIVLQAVEVLARGGSGPAGPRRRGHVVESGAPRQRRRHRVMARDGACLSTRAPAGSDT